MWRHFLRALGHEAEPEAYDVPEGEDYEDEYEGNAYEGEGQ